MAYAQYNPSSLKASYDSNLSKMVVRPGKVCDHCNGEPPDTISVTISGLSDCACIKKLYQAFGVAATVNDTFTLNIQSDWPGYCVWVFEDTSVSQDVMQGNWECTGDMELQCTHTHLNVGAYIGADHRVYIEAYYGGLWCGISCTAFGGGLLAFAGSSEPFDSETLCCDFDGSCDNTRTQCGEDYYQAVSGCNAGKNLRYLETCTGGTATFTF